MLKTKYLLPLILILLLTFTLTGNCDWLAGWDYRIELKIEDYAGDIGAEVVWFPVTVFLTAAQCEEIFTELTTDAEYLKVAFTKADGTTELYGECELFDIDKSFYSPVHSDTYVKATTKFSTNYWAYFATDPAKSLTGSSIDNSWAAAQDGGENQRFHIDLSSAEIITKIYYENYHSSGVNTDIGVNNFTFWGSNTGASFLELTYGTDTGWTQLTTSQSTFDEHVEADQADPKYITVTNTTAYRYYAFKFADNYGDVNDIGVRHIELQGNKAIYHVSRDGWTINANTSIFMYYDKDHADNTTYIGAVNTAAAEAVWDGNFKAVYHMKDGADTSHIDDSTSNNNDGTKVGANEPIEAAGQVGQGQDFDGDNDYISVSDNSTLDFTAAFTLEAIANPDSIDAPGRLIYKYDVTSGDGYLLYQSPTDDGLWGFYVYVADSADNAISNDHPSGAYQHIAGIRAADGGLTIYVDGELQTDTGSKVGAIDSSGTLYLGVDFNLDNDYAGIEDEVRISSTDRSAAWIKATYNSLWDTLLTYGSEEEAPVPAVTNVMFIFSNF